MAMIGKVRRLHYRQKKSVMPPPFALKHLRAALDATQLK